MASKRDAQALVTQAAFVINENHEMLLLQLPDGRWQLPGGKLHTKENWRDGLLREIQEEAGLTNISIVRVMYIDNWHTQSHDYYRAYFLCTTLDTQVHLSGDHRRAKWITSETDLDFYGFTHETVRAHIERFFTELT